MERIALVYPFGWHELLAMDMEQLNWWGEAAALRLKEKHTG